MSRLYSLLVRGKPGCCVVSVPQFRAYAKSPNAGPSGYWLDVVSSSSTLVHLKSTFTAYASRYPSLGEGSTATPEDVVADFITHLSHTFPRTKRATHAMWAWRRNGYIDAAASASGSPATFGCSDGGEAGAGERLSRLLELSRCKDVIVVVYRWYGGVQLGSQRWKCISTVAKEALQTGAFIPGPGDSSDAASKAGRREKTKRTSRKR
ncbi:uncharacterized protein FIBRA_03997 [Fibroporia radiculosa]|uniref:Impact N-terminal domain-containing protein n=1 Tax=Fibroporia radiculosa TaxID=599839 RepID=J4H2Q3_9APHY|nr:uncharacterized protein FIBRA_03997 [Fibroporia radiculosa]CCM01924.1 predicted protein [Fibroporia radiculosa]